MVKKCEACGSIDIDKRIVIIDVGMNQEYFRCKFCNRTWTGDII